MKTLKRILITCLITGLVITGLSFISPEKVEAITSLPDLQSFYSRTLTSSISSTATTINVSVAPNVNTGLFVLEPRTSNQEIVYMTGRTGTALTVVRGLATYGSSLTASTTNRAHAAGTAIEMADVHYYIKLLQDIILGSTSTPAMIIENATTTNATSTNFATTNFIATSGTTTYATSTTFYISSILQALSAIITTLTTDSLTVNTSASLPATTFTGTPTWNTTPSNASDLANKGYVDSVAIAGAASSSETVTGIVRIATKAQASAGTSAINGNRYVLPASMATSTSQVATTSVVVTNTIGKINGRFISGSFFGNGSDGDLVVSSNATATSNKFYRSVTVNNGIIFNTGGYAIYASDSITNNGTIQNNGFAGSAGVSGNNKAGGSGGSGGLGGYFYAGTSGGNGGASPTADGAAGAAGTDGTSVTGIGVTGSSGGAGQTDCSGGANGAGGAGGTLISEYLYPIIRPILTSNTFVASTSINYFAPVYSATASTSGHTLSSSGGGGGGGGGCSNISGGGTYASGGGAGGAGGTLFLASPIITNNGSITSNGGAGGNGGSGANSDGGGGAGGAGGNIILIYNQLTEGTITSNGGTGGTSVRGTNGTAGRNGPIFKISVE